MRQLQVEGSWYMITCTDPGAIAAASGIYVLQAVSVGMYPLTHMLRVLALQVIVLCMYQCQHCSEAAVSPDCRVMKPVQPTRCGLPQRLANFQGTRLYVKPHWEACCWQSGAGHASADFYVQILPCYTAQLQWQLLT